MSAGGWLATEPERYIHHPTSRGSVVDVAPGSLCAQCHELIGDGVLVMREGKGWRHAICPRRDR